MCVQYRGGYLEYRGLISWCTWGILWLPWGGVQYHGRKNLHYHHYNGPLGQCMEYVTRHLNSYHHNSESIGIMWGFVWDPFKSCFWAASSLFSLQHTSWVSYGTHSYKCFQAAFTLSSLQQTLQVSCGAPYETCLDKCLRWLPHHRH